MSVFVRKKVILESDEESENVEAADELAFNFRSFSGWKLDGNNPSGANKFFLLLMK